MREILFRGKRTDNSEWVEGSLILTTSTMEKPFIVDSCWCYSGSVDDEGYAKFEYLNAYEVIPESVSEFTGLTDKNGKKIFEGDVVKYKNTDGIKFNGVALTVIGKVVYNEKNASFAISGKDEIGAKHYDYFPIKNIEVVGNIHDNPELLKGGD